MFFGQQRKITYPVVQPFFATNLGQANHIHPQNGIRFCVFGA
jgi:hypothetical protein